MSGAPSGRGSFVNRPQKEQGTNKPASQIDRSLTRALWLPTLTSPGADRRHVPAFVAEIQKDADLAGARPR